jgi:hypothetical protein
MSDQATLEQLNRDYITSVQNSDVRRFDEILAEDFYCSNPDGSIVDRKGFLTQTAKPVTIKNLEAKDVMMDARAPDATPTAGPSATGAGSRSSRTSRAARGYCSTSSTLTRTDCGIAGKECRTRAFGGRPL